MKVTITIEIPDANMYANKDSFPAAMMHVSRAANNIVKGLQQHFELDAEVTTIEEYYGTDHTNNTE